MNFVFISPNFPLIYSHFVKSLKQKGVNVFGIGDTPKEQITPELKENLVEYCFVKDLSNEQWMKDTLDYLEKKYGKIDYLESNNEYWLLSDSKLREYKNIPNGFRPDDMDKIKYKSKMKECFNKAGVKVARYILLDNLKQAQEFALEVGYPLFVKPNNGVGAAKSYKIANEQELINFVNTKPNEQFILEEYLDGVIVTFDGIVDDESNPLLMYNETFPIPVSEVVNGNLDDYYYANMDMADSFRNMGKAVVKAFGIRKRCFHIEFFLLKENRPGLAEKGEIIALEVNMRSPGGDTPDLLSICLDNSYYDAYADIIVDNKINFDLNKKHYIAISVSRKDRFTYLRTIEEIQNKYQDNIIRHDHYSKEMALVMGNEFWMARFETVEEALSFKDFVMEKK